MSGKKGCARPVMNLVACRFGRLIVIERASAVGQTPVRWLCLCDCGARKSVAAPELRRGNVRSCGCLRAETQPIANRTHGQAGSGNGTPEYNAWTSMRKRCLNKRHRFYALYGGRGITICSRWIESFENFFADMGLRPSCRHSLDRRDNDGNYEPLNCRWATRTEQAQNQRHPRRGTDGRFKPGPVA